MVVSEPSKISTKIHAMQYHSLSAHPALTRPCKGRFKVGEGFLESITAVPRFAQYEKRNPIGYDLNECIRNRYLTIYCPSQF